MRKCHLLSLLGSVLALGLLVSWISSAPAPLPRVTRGRGLYADEVIRAIAGDERGRLADGDGRCRDDCANGESRPLGAVMRKLGRDLARFRQPRWSAWGKVLYVTWQVSPTYDLTCRVSEPSSE